MWQREREPGPRKLYPLRRGSDRWRSDDGHCCRSVRPTNQQMPRRHEDSGSTRRSAQHDGDSTRRRDLRPGARCSTWRPSRPTPAGTRADAGRAGGGRGRGRLPLSSAETRFPCNCEANTRSTTAPRRAAYRPRIKHMPADGPSRGQALGSLHAAARRAGRQGGRARRAWTLDGRDGGLRVTTSPSSSAAHRGCKRGRAGVPPS